MKSKDNPTEVSIESVELTDAYGRLALRNGVVLAFFFDQPPENVSPQISKALDIYLAAVPAGSLKYAVTSASAGQYKPFGPGTVAACKKQLNPIGVMKRELTSVRLNSSGSKAPEYEFHFLGRRPDSDWPDAQSVLNIIFPIHSVNQEQLASFFKTITELSKSVDYVYGYCSPALLTMELALDIVENKELRGRALRYPGYDVPSNMDSSHQLGIRVRGARWITWLSSQLVKKLGGVANLNKQLSEPMLIETIANGVMIRAGEFPELGDVNRKKDTPMLRQVAKVLEPITFFGDEFSAMYQLFGDAELLNKWERRFLD